MKNPYAVRFKTLAFDQVIQKQLRVMDIGALEMYRLAEPADCSFQLLKQDARRLDKAIAERPIGTVGEWVVLKVVGTRRVPSHLKTRTACPLLGRGHLFSPVVLSGNNQAVARKIAATRNRGVMTNTAAIFEGHRNADGKSARRVPQRPERSAERTRSPQMLDSLRVDTTAPCRRFATAWLPCGRDAATIVIKPYVADSLEEIEKAIRA